MAEQDSNTKDSSTKSGVITIKKYANRRLYNTATSSYVTLDHLAEIVKGGLDFIVTDAKTGKDITQSVLTQIIVEQEGKGQNLLPIKFLRQVIGFYGDSLGGLVPRYLEHSMDSFHQNESHMRGAMGEAMKGLFPMQQLEKISKQNMTLFENAMKMWNPFAQVNKAGGAGTTPKGAAQPEEKGEDIDALKSQLNVMQAQIEKLVKDRT